MSTESNSENELLHVRRLNALGFDILLFSGSISHASARQMMQLVRSRKAKAKKLLFALCTYGGSPDAAYSMMRCLQDQYPHITILTPIFCKSAGTLMAIGADSLVMPDSTELGPLDMQVLKHDEVGSMTTSLTPQNALKVLTEASFMAFKRHFASLRLETGYQLTSKTCADIAVRLTVGMLEPIYAQIDPMRLAEMDRKIQVARCYGMRLSRGNLKENALETLILGLPSHEFIIDRKEATDYFVDIRKPTPDEQQLADDLNVYLRGKMAGSDDVLFYVDPPATETTDDTTVSSKTGQPADSTVSTTADGGIGQLDGEVAGQCEPKPIGRGQGTTSQRSGSVQATPAAE